MKRDVRLHGLTADHHHALVLAWRIKRAAAGNGILPELVVEARQRYESELATHFAIEEEELLPALRTAGRTDLADRTWVEHETLRARLGEAEQIDAARLTVFGKLLDAHVRFEENELFPACEHLLEDAVLERVAARAPKGKAPGY